MPTGPTINGEPTGEKRLPRIVDQAKAQGNAWDTGVVPGCQQTELNSTIAEEVKNVAVDQGSSRKAC